MSVVPAIEPELASESLPHPRELLVAFAGFAALGLCAGLGSGDLSMSARSVPSALLVGTGALLLTGPALVVAHQFLGLDGRPEALVGALGRGFATAGRVALGLCAPMLFFSATSSLWAVVFTLLVAGTGVHAFAFTARRLVETEPARGALDVRMLGLVASWCVLTALIALRLAWDVAWFVAGS